MGQFGDIFHSQSLGLVLKKLHITRKQTAQKQNSKKPQTHKSTHKPKILNINQQLTLTTAHKYDRVGFNVPLNTL